MQPMVRFAVDGTAWLVAIDAVRGVRSADALLRLPDPEAAVAGVVAVDGETFPVVRSLADQGRHVVLVTSGGRGVGVLVDEALGVCDIDPAHLRPAPSGQRRRLVAAVHGPDTDPAFVLAVDDLVNEICALEEMAR